MNLESIASYIESLPALGLTRGQNLFIHMIPATVGRAVGLVMENPWAKADMEIIGRYSGRLQVIVRDDDYARGKNLAYALRDALTFSGPRVFGDQYSYYCIPVSSPLSYPRPASDLIEWSISFAMEYRDIS